MSNPIHIMLVEDNEGDILLTKEALEERKIANRITVAKDGKQAIDTLNHLDEHQKNELPDLILLDINLPKKNGHEVLYHIKNTNGLKHIPVIILTTSSSKHDIMKAYENYVNCYITKPVDVSEFISAVGTIENFWISIVCLPNKNM